MLPAPRPISALASLLLLAACGGSERTGGVPLTVNYGGVFMGNDGTEGGNMSLTLCTARSSPLLG